MTKTTKLPERLYAAFAWTEAAGELKELASLDPPELDTYCRESVANCEDGDVTEFDLHELAEWLRTHEWQ